MKKWGSLVLTFLLIICLLPASASAEVSTRRDDKGVWFIEGNRGDSLYEVFEAMGYAVAEDRLWQMETFRRTANGTLSAIFGPSQTAQDIFMRTIGYSDTELTEGYNSLNEETRAVIDGYVAGVNKRIAEVSADPSQLPYEFHAIGINIGLEVPLLPRNWTPEDVLAWQALLNRQFDPGALNHGQLDNAALIQYLQKFFEKKAYQMFNDLRWINDPDAQTYIPDTYRTEAAGEGKTAKPFRFGRSRAAAVTDLPKSDHDLSRVVQKLRKHKQKREKALKKINAWVKMGSYAWVVSGDKTASGRPILYSGPQMGFSVPAIVQEGSIEAAGLEISGMAIPGLPGIVIGRTPHHSWSMQVGHAHTTDYYCENVFDVRFDREETIQVAGEADITIPVYRSDHGPIINPLPYNPTDYDPDNDGPIIAWRYSHWGEEFENLTAFLNLARAKSMDEFGAALRNVSVSQHFCYSDKDGNIAYWMSGMDPVRPEGFDYRFPQGMGGAFQAEWDDDVLKPLSTDRNTAQGFYCGWNNKSSADYPNSYNNMSYFFGPFHRAHVIEDYLESHEDLTFEEIRDLALNIATTDSIRNGGNPWAFVESYFREAVNSMPTEQRMQALYVMDGFDGHFVAGGKEYWVDGMDRSDAWMLSDAWIREVIDLTFSDELLRGGPLTASAIGIYDPENEEWEHPTILFNVILHALDPNSAITNNYNWFDDINTDTEESADQIIVGALDNVLDELGDRPWGNGLRGEIEFNHSILSHLNPLHTMPFSSRSTYAHCVEMSPIGPIRIESMFPLGESGSILADPAGALQFDENFYSMTELFDSFVHRDFPIFIPRGRGVGHGPIHGAGDSPGYGFGHGHKDGPGKDGKASWR